MKIEEAGDVQMTHGLHKGKSLSQVPFNYLKWISKNWIKRDMREAATIVLNSRAKDVGQELNLKVPIIPKIKLRCTEKQDFSKGAFPSLQKLWDETPVDLF